MFRPDRIGTPTFHEQAFTPSTVNFTPASSLIASAVWNANVINANPVADLGRSALQWTGSEAITAGHKWALGQQFTVTQPVAGDAVGFELNGSILIQANHALIIVPFIQKLSAAGSTTLEGVVGADMPTPLPLPSGSAFAASDSAIRVHNYQTRVVERNTAVGAVAGTYIHGFSLIDAGFAGYTTTFFQVVCSVRQLNDQQTVGYRDTLR